MTSCATSLYIMVTALNDFLINNDPLINDQAVSEKRLTLVIPTLGCGGAERVMTVMANFWAARGWPITMLTLDDASASPFYELDFRVRHFPLGLANDSRSALSGLRNNLERVLFLRRAIKSSRPDAVISFLDTTNVITLLATRGLNIPVIVSERIDPARHDIGRAWNRLRNWTYPMADLVVAQSDAALNYFSSEIRSRSSVIPNPVSRGSEGRFVANKKMTNKKTASPALIAVGRLDRQKGFDLLIEAFAEIKDRHNEWTLTILGEGLERQKLESLRGRLGLASRVFLPGNVKNLHDILARANLFVMSSRYEGFPNALCEAMAHGLAVISTDCPSGPREIIRDGVDGLLVASDSAGALASAMDRLMSSEIERTRLALRAPEVAKRFGVERVMEMWNAALNEVCSAK